MHADIDEAIGLVHGIRRSWALAVAFNRRVAWSDRAVPNQTAQQKCKGTPVDVVDDIHGVEAAPRVDDVLDVLQQDAGA